MIAPLSPMPWAPSRLDLSRNFAVDMDAFLGYLPNFRIELNAAIDAINAGLILVDGVQTIADQVAASAAAAIGASNYSATSASSINLALTSQTMNLAQTGKGFANGDKLVLYRRSDTDTRVYATYTAFTSGTGAGTVTVTRFVGSGGPYSDWLVVHAAFETTPANLEANLKAFAIAAAIAL